MIRVGPRPACPQVLVDGEANGVSKLAAIHLGRLLVRADFERSLLLPAA